ncbi:MAG: ABC transporter ATP-binding protein [Acidimicrobiia bacterium]
MAVLSTKDLSVRFGGVVANSDVNIEVPQGSLVGLIGPNGAGKTTFIDALTGFVRSTGEITFDGERIDGWPSHKRSRAGLLRTFQSVELFEDLTVGENLLAHADPFTPGSWLTDLVRPARVEAVELAPLELLGLEEIADEMPSELSHGTRRLVGIARALASKPKLLLLDEPAAGLDGAETALLGEKLRLIVDQGLATILLVDHDMELVMKVCDDIYVLNFGALIAHGNPEEVQRDELVRSAYLGDEEGEDAA